jgi:hypothetical protein
LLCSCSIAAIFQLISAPAQLAGSCMEMKLNVADLQQIDTFPQTAQNQKRDTSYDQSSAPGSVG